jgi:hypothetical protein
MHQPELSWLVQRLESISAEGPQSEEKPTMIKTHFDRTRATSRVALVALATGLLLAAALACNLPFTGNQTSYDTVATAAQQTIVAQSAAATVSASLSQSAQATRLALEATQPTTTVAVEATAAVQATQMAQAALATSQSAQFTALASGAQATSNAMAAAATAQSQKAQATALWLAATQTAMAWPSQPSQPQPQPPSPPLPPPPQPPVYNLTPIQFAPGATSAYVEGNLAKNSTADYSVSASKGQWLLVDVSSPSNNISLGIIGMRTGVPLLNPASGSSNYQGVLPATQPYHLTLSAGNQNTNFAMNVIIPARIQFAPGAIAAGVPGKVGANQTNYYTAWAKAGQTMTVNISSPGNTVLLTIYGMSDGQPLVRSVSGATSWSGVLPGSQDYMIEATSSGPASKYNIDVMIK